MCHTFLTESGKHNYEVDFLIADGDKISPVEVKSSGYKAHASLDAFCKKFSARIRNNEAQLARKQPSDRTSGKLKALAVLLVLLFLASNAAIRFFGSEMLNPGIRMLLRASIFMAFILPYGFIWSVTRGSKE